MTLKIFVFDEIKLNKGTQQKPLIEFFEEVFSVFRTVKVVPNLLARPPTFNLGAKNSAVSHGLTSAFFANAVIAYSSLKIREGYGN